jgi:ABC-type nitrate/sulfonate/bicarbonate transport system permease component
VGYVFGAYCGTIGAIVIYLLYRGYYFQEKVFDNFTEIVKIAIVPIVTLVIGYYFGTEKSDK